MRRNAKGENDMNPMIWFVVGGVLGWLASIETGARGSRDLVVNCATGVAGAMIAGWLLSSPFGPDAIRSSEFSLAGLIVAPLGAIILLAIVNLIRLARIP
jgi:uncharacterized membrane protein YeaQ/YmgE (transglycosylase-associated protein family)